MLFAAAAVWAPLRAGVAEERSYAEYIAEKREKLDAAGSMAEMEIALDVPGTETDIRGKVSLPDGSPPAGFEVCAVSVTYLHREITVEWSESNPNE